MEKFCLTILRPSQCRSSWQLPSPSEHKLYTLEIKAFSQIAKWSFTFLPELEIQPFPYNWQLPISPIFALQTETQREFTCNTESFLYIFVPFSPSDQPARIWKKHSHSEWRMCTLAMMKGSVLSSAGRGSSRKERFASKQPSPPFPETLWCLIKFHLSSPNKKLLQLLLFLSCWTHA